MAKKELCRATYRASHFPGVIQIVATGTHGRGGYKVFFEPLRGPFQVALYHEAPEVGPDVITPFVATTELVDKSNKVFKVLVVDANGKHVIDVEPVFDLRFCGNAGIDPLPKPGKCGDWYAILDKMPPAPDRLIVTGTCTFPTAGWKVELRPRVPQGINPEVLLLERIVTPPTGFAAQVITQVPVRYEQDATIDYTQVDIDGEVVDVQVVH
jgi:hypothetical protein